MDLASKNMKFNPDPFGIVASCTEVQKAWMNNPRMLSEELGKLALEIWTLEEWQWLTSGTGHEDLYPTLDYDKRFKYPTWLEHPVYDSLKETYLLYSSWLEDAINATPNVDDKARRKASFWVREMLNALAPTNNFFTNPEAMNRFLTTNGSSVVDGWQNFLADAKKGVISMSDQSEFEVGKNLGTTPGDVVYRNELLELIQYTPTTEKVHEVPIVIVAPWINKFYILDLDEKKSMIRYLVDQGYTVFVTSWKNVGSDMRHTTLDDYMLKGVLEAVDAARDICEVPQVHAVGYCIGGTIVSALMAWLAHPDNAGRENPIAHWTLFASLVDFDKPGDIDVFIDENTIGMVEQQMEKNGYLDGKDMAAAFRMLRSNSLIWHYFVNSYLCGEPPEAFDVLYWNMDATRMPEAMHGFYLRELYLNNKLVQKDAINLGGLPLDLGRIEQPLYSVGTEQDHIAPWQETYKIREHVSGPVRYVLATSGHILGIISPPVDPPKRRYWAGDVEKDVKPDTWLAEIENVSGSWWTDWVEWLDPKCGSMAVPPKPGGSKYLSLAKAPGTYVLES